MGRPRIPTADLIADLQRVGGDDPPTESEYDAEGKHSARTIKDRFNTWNTALAVAGYPQRPPEAKTDVSPEALVDLYYRQAKPLTEVAERLDVSFGVVEDRLEQAGIPADLPKNIRYLLYNPPTPVSELPATHSPSGRRLGVTVFRLRNGSPVAYLQGEHTAADVIRAFVEANPTILDGMDRGAAVMAFGRHGPAFREAARTVLPELDDLDLGRRR